MSSKVWTPDREGLLKVLWAQGLSPREIAKRLGGGLTRNAIIGKRMRMGLPERVTPRNPRGTKPKPVVVKVAVQPRLKPEPIRKPRAPERSSTSVRHDQRNWYQCPMFCVGEEGASGFVCGAEIAFPADKFCKNCARIAYAPAPPIRVRRAA